MYIRRLQDMRELDWQILYELHRMPHLTNVAKMLYVTQPSLTKRLKNMEEEFGVDIVNRTPKGLEFTEAGNYLAGRAEIYLKFKQDTEEGLKELMSGTKEVLRLGSAYTFSKYNLRGMLDPFTESHPGLMYQIVNKQSDILYQMVLDGQLDAAFVRGDYGDNDNRVRLEPTPGYLVTRQPVETARLPEMNRIIYQTGRSTTAVLNKWWRDRFGDVPVREGMTAGYIDFALNLLVNEGDYLIMFMPGSQLEPTRNATGLSIVPVYYSDGTPVTRGTWFVFNSDKRISRVLEDFIGYVKKNKF